MSRDEDQPAARRRVTVTLIDVAKAAKVSRTTASAALGGSGRISPDTRDKVRAVAAELGYVANPAARHLQGGRKGAIGLYVPDNLTDYSYYMELAFGAAEAAREHGFAVTLVTPKPGTSITPLLAHVDGFVIIDPQIDDPFVREMIAGPLPVLADERVLEGEPPDVTMATDHGTAIRALLDHLAAQGAQRPALLNLELELAWTRLVEDVFRGWCAERAIDPVVRRIPVVRRVPAAADPGASVRELVRALLAEPGAPDAIVSVPDGTALGAIAAARDAGLTVGEDLLVASCVDSFAMQLATPPVTAIVLRPRVLGREVAEILIQRVLGQETPAVVHRERPELVLRASTGVREDPDADGTPSASGVAAS